MKEYHRLLNKVLTEGQIRKDRTGVGCLSIFGEQSRYDLSEGFPLVTTKKVHLKSVIHELLWMLRGDTNTKYLNDNGVTIWDEWANRHGNLGPVYGKQWRSWDDHRGANSPHLGRAAFDQMEDLVRGIRNDPHSRRHVVSAWNVADLPHMALPPCHCLFQFFVRGEHLDCQLYQRSADIFLGVPFNIASYALLTMMVAQVTGYKPGEFIHTYGDLHLYMNHLGQAALQLSREPRPLPIMKLNPEVKGLFAFQYEDFTLEGYDPHPAISAPVAV